MSDRTPSAPAKGTAVYICHCGHNIASTVDVAALAEEAAGRPGVSVARHYPYLCSRPGQELIRKDLRDGLASRVVVCACSPRMHETTFRKAVEAEGVNPYLFHHVNLREQCSWVHADRAQATDKARDLLAAGLGRVVLQEPLAGSTMPVLPRALVLGAGPAGLTAAAELSALGIEVVLVEAAARLGGRAATLGRSFPEGGEVGPWLSRRVAEVQGDPRVEILTESRLTEVSGSAGNFNIRIQTPGGEVERAAGAVLLATGFDLYRPDAPEGGRPELAFGDPRVLTQESLEELLRASEGPLALGGKPVRSAVFLQCVGSRDRTTAGAHCSRTCCMVSVRQAQDLRARNPECDAQVLYMDLRAYARGAEEAYEKAGRDGVRFRRGMISEIYTKGGELAVRWEDTIEARAHETPADLVVLACGARPRADAGELARLLRLARGSDGFFLEAHLKLRPTETASDGFYLAGACQSPKTLDEAVQSGRAAALKAATPLLRGWMPVDPIAAVIDPEQCSGCGLCAAQCPASAIQPVAHLPIFKVEAALCKGCGACAAACPSKAMQLRHYRPRQVFAELDCLST